MRENSHIIKGAISHVIRSSIFKPLVKILVRIKPIKVVTNAIPPLTAGIYLIDIFIIKGPNKAALAEKKSKLTKKLNASIWKPGSNIAQKINPVAFANTYNIDDANNLII